MRSIGLANSTSTELILPACVVASVPAAGALIRYSWIAFDVDSSRSVAGMGAGGTARVLTPSGKSPLAPAAAVSRTFWISPACAVSSAFLARKVCGLTLAVCGASACNCATRDSLVLIIAWCSVAPASSTMDILFRNSIAFGVPQGIRLSIPVGPDIVVYESPVAKTAIISSMPASRSSTALVSYLWNACVASSSSLSAFVTSRRIVASSSGKAVSMASMALTAFSAATRPRSPSWTVSASLRVLLSSSSC